MKEKIPLPKDSMKRIINMMEYVEEHRERLDEKDMKEKFDNNNFNLFSRYCLGEEEYAALVGTGKYRLTQIGVRRLYELRRLQADEDRIKWTIRATIAIATFTGVQAFFLALPWVLKMFGVS